MQKIITMELLAAMSQSKFSLDELVSEIDQLFSQKALAKLLGVLLQLMDELLAIQHISGKAAKPRRCKCGQYRYEIKDRLERSLDTRLGTTEFAWRRLECAHCGATWVPLREFLNLERWQSKSSELERVILEIITEQSYRRTSRHLKLAASLEVPKSTLHRWVVESDASQWEPQAGAVDVLMPDGTGYKRRVEPGKTSAGELRVVLGRKPDGQWVAYGAWSGKSWPEIAEQLRGQGSKPRIRGKMLVSDGERGLADALAELANRQQRSHWHMARDLRVFLWHDKAPPAERKSSASELGQLLGISLPAGDFESVKAEDKKAVQHQVDEAENGVRQLVKNLLAKGYHKAAAYIEAAQEKLFSYARFWLKTGLVCPRTTSFLERLMRELGRRLKRIAFGWSESGAAQMARLILRRVVNHEEWEAYWKKRLGFQNRVHISLRSIKVLN
jgi:Uncharacterised protein family (UPF0236)